MEPKRSSAAPVAAAAVLLLLPLLYVSGYYALLTPEQGWFSPFYRFGGSTAQTLFEPMHWLDRQVRAGYWNERTRQREYIEEVWNFPASIPEPEDGDHK
jgi:hypothetical protein